MKKQVTLTLCGIPYEAWIRRTPYIDGGAPALTAATEDGSPLATLTSNLPFSKAKLTTGNHTFIKDYSENEGVLSQLVAQKIVRDTGERVQTGFTQACLVEIIDPLLRIVCVLLLCAISAATAVAGDHAQRKAQRERSRNWIIERQEAYQVQGVPTSRLIIGKREIDIYRDGQMFERGNLVGVKK
jgi:hypothetical protein